MIISKLKKHCGSKIEFENPLDFFKQNIKWKELLYKEKLLIFKKMNFTLLDYVKFGEYFGSPWVETKYDTNLEYSVDIHDPETNIHYAVSPFANYNTWIPNQHMEWHADLANRDNDAYAIRSLWITKNPNPFNSGKKIGRAHV